MRKPIILVSLFCGAFLACDSASPSEKKGSNVLHDAIVVPKDKAHASAKALEDAQEREAAEVEEAFDDDSDDEDDSSQDQ